MVSGAPFRGAAVLLRRGYRNAVAAFLYAEVNWRCFRISKQGHQINEEIRDKEDHVRP